MKNIWKNVVKSLVYLAVGGVLIGYVSFLMLMGFGGVNLNLAKALPVALSLGLVYLVLYCNDWLKKPWARRLGIGYLAVVVLCAGYALWGFYEDSIPVMDDRDSLLYDYIPNGEGSLAVKLEEESTLKFQEAAIRMDGATALYPVYAGFVQAVYPERVYEPWDYSYDTADKMGLVVCTGTTMAYERLINGETDIIFVAGPSDDQLAMAREAGMELHLTPIGREAFVFFVNSENPVTGLTVEEIQGIYSGEITNWKELGGKWQRIRAYQRAENSGSQTALQRLMAGHKLMEPETEDRIAGMGGIINQVASYRNHKNAIGFSFRFYSTEMVRNDQIRLLALNGVEPTVETIRDGSYPIASNFYAVTATPIGEPAPEEENEDLAALIEWILSEQGQWIIEETGYVGVN